MKIHKTFCFLYLHLFPQLCRAPCSSGSLGSRLFSLTGNPPQRLGSFYQGSCSSSKARVSHCHFQISICSYDRVVWAYRILADKCWYPRKVNNTHSASFVVICNNLFTFFNIQILPMYLFLILETKTLFSLRVSDSLLTGVRVGEP